MGGRDAARNRASGSGAEVATRQTGEVAEGNGTRSDVRHLFAAMRPEIERALPKHMDPDRLARVALTVVQQNPDLARCDARTLLGALMTCAQVGLEPGPQGHVYFVPYRNRRENTVTLTFILGYQGMIELARRSGLLMSIAAHTIYQNEVDGKHGGEFAVEYGTNNRLTHKPIVFGERGPAVGYYATARLKSPASDATEDVFVVLSKGEVDGFRQRSATQRDTPSGPWSTDYEAMAWKTCIRRLARWLPQSPELAAAMQHEETVRTEVVRNVVDEAEPKPPEPFGDGQGVVGELAGKQTPAQPPAGATDAETQAADRATGEIPPTEEELPPGHRDYPEPAEYDPTADPSWGQS